MAIEAGTSTYYQAKRGIVQDGLLINFDIGVQESYRQDNILRNLNGTQTASFTNSPSYINDGGGSISFDGTDDQINLINPNHSRLLSSSLEVVFKKYSNPSYPPAYKAIIFGYEHTGGSYSNYVSGTMALNNDGKIKASVICDNPSQTSPRGYFEVSSTTSLTVNQYYHIVLNKSVNEDESGQLKLYVNGTLEGTRDFPARLAYWVGAYRGTNYLEMAGTYRGGTQYAGAGHLSGAIAIARCYNKVLSDDEITQNFNATRRRFGL
jgi:hypothetical protein